MSAKLIFLRPGSPIADFAPFTSNPAALRRLVVRYTQGECAVLATRIRELTGWPIVHLLDPPSRVLPLHYANRRPDGGLVDITGRYPRGLDVLATAGHDCASPIWMSGPSFSLDRNDRRRANTVLDSPWGLYLVRPDERR
ncbi:hypothetical protein [Caulobacter vibrioides]|jgi:hypothetical protein|uniref:hypothetical protein n=1 Tax=Caulobacter vibrioides TaxID=155892 RepID=UPI00054D03CE|nr:hypothetical protein [Caulobacter vibrioides]